MSDDRDEGSSSGLMIGMIIGGVVVLGLIAVVILGGALFWLHEDVAIAPAGGGPVAVVADPGIDEDAPLPPRPELILDNPREWLIGVWESKANDGGITTMEFRADGTLHMADKKPGKAELVQPVVKWEVRRDQDTIKVKIGAVKGEPNEHRLRFLDGDRMTIDTMPGVVYQRQGLEPAK